LAALIVVLTQTAPTAPAAVAAVVASAKGLSAAAGPVNPDAAPTQIGSRRSLSAGGQPIQVSYYRFGSVEALVAESSQQFPMPPGGSPIAGSTGMAWKASKSGISLLCLNGSPAMLLAGRLPLTQLQSLAARLHLP
jgi:hypothetical protein